MEQQKFWIVFVPDSTRGDAPTKTYQHEYEASNEAERLARALHKPAYVMGCEAGYRPDPCPLAQITITEELPF